MHKLARGRDGVGMRAITPIKIKWAPPPKNNNAPNNFIIHKFQPICLASNAIKCGLEMRLRLRRRKMVRGQGSGGVLQKWIKQGDHKTSLPLTLKCGSATGVARHLCHARCLSLVTPLRLKPCSARWRCRSSNSSNSTTAPVNWPHFINCECQVKSSVEVSFM